MVNILEKHYFKKYLHKNCHRWWFTKDGSNAKHKNSDGTYDVEAYADEYTIRVREILEDPYLSSDNRALRYSEIAANGGAAVAAISAASMVTGPLGFLFTNTALVMTGAGTFSGVMGQVAGGMKNAPEDVYFHITGDDSYWKVEQVPCGGIRGVAYKICKWSNEVYRERYIQRRSDNYEFQNQIEQRPPTPY